MKFQNKLAFITGGGSGLGEATATSMAQYGAWVAIADINFDNAVKVAQKISAGGGKALPVKIDVADEVSVEEAFSTVEQWANKSVDILVNSAGIIGIHALLDYPVDLFKSVIAVNVTGAFLCAKRAAAGMVNQRYGRIINLTSISAERAGIGRTAYGTSKVAVAGLTRQLAMELGHFGVTSNAVAPGPVLTAMTAESYNEDTIREYSSMIPAGRMGKAEEIANAIMFLASEESGYINGVYLPVDGGYLASGIAKTGTLGQ